MTTPKSSRRDFIKLASVAGLATARPATGHMIISARSKSVFGPWENSPLNPIIRTKDSNEKWWSKGHGTPFEDARGNWRMVFHAYESP